jgi:hypothetical protein
MRAIRDAMNLADAEGTVGAPVDCYEPDELAGFVTQVLERSETSAAPRRWRSVRASRVSATRSGATA